MEKKNISYIGTCISRGILKQFKMMSVFDVKEQFFDALPWHFYEMPMRNVGGAKKEILKSCCKIYCSMWENLFEADCVHERQSDMLMIDLYALLKPMIKISFDIDMHCSTKVILGAWREVVKNNCIGFYHGEREEYVNLSKEYVYESLRYFAMFLLDKYSAEQIIVVRPKLCKRCLNDEFCIESPKEEILREVVRKEEILIGFTDFLSNELGECIVVDVPDDVISSEGDIGGVHYIQADYMRIADTILEKIGIDYRKYWNYDISPEDLQYEQWVRKSKVFYQIARKGQESLLDTRIGNRERVSLPVFVNSKIESLGMVSVDEMQRIILERMRACRVLAFWGAGQRCSAILKKSTLPVTCIIDNDTCKVGKTIENVTIVCPDDIEDWSRYFIVITCLETDEIEHQLNCLNLKKNVDYILAKEFFDFI